MKKVAKIIVTLFLISLPAILFAQPTNPDSWQSGTNVMDVNTPFDSGVVLLVVIALCYGLLKIRAYRKSEKLKVVSV